MDAPLDFAAWLTSHEHPDPVYGWVYRYHSRSDAHSVRALQAGSTGPRRVLRSSAGPRAGR